jgi:hypothetical protein
MLKPLIIIDTLSKLKMCMKKKVDFSRDWEGDALEADALDEKIYE